MNKAVFLDRDGIINKAIVKDGLPASPLTIEEAVPVDGILSVITDLWKDDFTIIGITNQPDIARGKITQDEAGKLNAKIASWSPYIRSIFVCPHDDDDLCNCRKPMPGFLFLAAEIFNISLRQSWMVGDRWKDIEAGYRARCQTIFIDYQYGDELRPSKQTHTVSSVKEIFPLIMKEYK